MIHAILNILFMWISASADYIPPGGACIDPQGNPLCGPDS